MNFNKSPLSDTTIWLMVGTALLFDALQIALSWMGIGIILIPIEYGLFIAWFRMHGISFLSWKRAPTLAVGALIETLTAGIFPAFTAVVLRVALTSKIKEAEGKVIGHINPKSGDKRDLDRAA